MADVWPLPGSRGMAAFFRRVVEDPPACPGSALKAHQRVIAKFLSPDSPYRGLLAVHGVGAGKTLSAAAVIAAAFSPGAPPAWVVLPAALKDGFAAELASGRALAEFECGPWARSGAGWVKRRDGVPFHELGDADRADVAAAVRNVGAAVRFLSLNGLTRDVLAGLEGAAKNPFDGAVVVVDECHRLIQAVAKAGEPSSAADRSLHRRLYDLLKGARAPKLVLLSATPLINVPRELAYAVNACVGAIPEHRVRWSRPLTTAQQAAARAALLRVPAVMDCRCTSAGAVVTFAPPGFEAVSRSAQTVRRAAQHAGPERRAKAALAAVAQFAGRGAALETELFDALPAADFEATFVHPDTGAVLRQPLLMRRLRGCVSFFADRDDALYPDVTYAVARVPMSDTQHAAYVAARDAERELESRGRERDEDLSVHRSYSRAALNFVFPAGAAKVHRGAARTQRERERRAAENVRRAKASGIWDDDAALAEHSPKFAAVLRAVRDEPGCAMLYSSFRELEGLGLMAHLLERRGFRRLDVVRTGGKGRRFALRGAGAGPAFVLPTLGTADGTDLLRLFCGEPLPEPMRRSAEQLFDGRLDNRRGELVKLVMLSASGAQGVDLKCVRWVHILEPHWHDTQLEQVAGRAVRMGSHAALPPEERNVRVVTYVAVFSDAQRAAPAFRALEAADQGMTSDEALVAIAARKRRTLQPLTALMARAAVDCGLYRARAACYRPPADYMPADIGAVRARRFAVQVPGGRVTLHADGSRLYTASGRHVGDVEGDAVAWRGRPPRPDR